MLVLISVAMRQCARMRAVTLKDWRRCRVILGLEEQAMWTSLACVGDVIDSRSRVLRMSSKGKVTQPDPIPAMPLCDRGP